MKNSKYILWFFLLLLLNSGCNLEGLDIDKLSKETTLSPEFVAPIAKADITVWDLVQFANKEIGGVISKDTNGLINIVYKKNDLFNYRVRDFLNLPKSQNISSGDKLVGDFSPENVSVSKNISLNDLIANMNGALNNLLQFNGMTISFPSTPFTNIVAKFSLDPITDFTSITLSKGSLGIVMENKLKVPITIQGNLFDIVNNRVITDFTFTNVAPGEKKNTSASLDGKQISNNIEFRMISFSTTGSVEPVLINLSDYFKLDFNLTGLGISQGNLKIKNSQNLIGSSGFFGFDFPEPDLKAFSAVLKKGTLKIETTNSSKLSGAVNFTLMEIKKDGNPVNASIPLGGASTSIDLSGANINFTSDPTFPYNRIPYQYSLTVNPSTGYIAYSSTDIINLNIIMDNLEFKSIMGDFGKRKIQFFPGIFDMDINLLDKIDGSFTPSLVLTIRNSIGMPAKVAFNMSATNNITGQTVVLKRNPSEFEIPVPANLSEGIKTGNVEFNNQNSNIMDFIALPPNSEISYMGQVDFNSSSQAITPLNPNFLDVDANLSIDMAMHPPLELQISNMAFIDTSGIEGSDYEKIESAELILNAKNGIPLDIDLQLLFVDTISKQQLGASKVTKILSAAQVSSSGMITTVQSSKTFSLSSSDMVNLRKTNGLVFIGKISSSEEGKTVAPILSDRKIELTVVIKAKVNL